MSRVWKWSLRAMFVGIGLALFSGPCLAAGNFIASTTTSDEPHEQSWSREQQQPAKPDPKAIVQQKAEMRAEQRMSRMASMQWYGMSNSRPQASPTPFSTRYSPLWETPGGSPYSWFPCSRPGYVMYWR
ncbi:MAG TPA: hypothetical protein VHU84_04255 [Lacipirellulaceae bacterium]|nr:hypothetical protein [Lacipirellulaceae bacterium]